MRFIKYRLAYSLLLISCLLFIDSQAYNASQWSESELALLRLQWLGSLPTLSPDPSNQYADDLAAARFGHRLFFDNRLSGNGEISCASCHIPEMSFTDGLAKAKGIANTLRSTPSLIGIAYSPWFFWDGSSDSLWSQALSPLESIVEHGGNRTSFAHIIYNNSDYRNTYQDLFGELPDLSNKKRFPDNAAPIEGTDLLLSWEEMVESDQKAITQIFVNLSKAIAAYERLLLPSASRFDQYAEAILTGESSNALTNDEVAGLKLFIGKAMCVTCHQGPLFTNHGFHNVGIPDPASKKSFALFSFFKEKPRFDVGRYHGVKKALASEFNCLGEYSDATEEDCAELIFANTKYTATLGAFKVPTLRNIAFYCTIHASRPIQKFG